MLCVKTWRFREGKQWAYGHKASKQQFTDSELTHFSHHVMSRQASIEEETEKAIKIYIF